MNERADQIVDPYVDCQTAPAGYRHWRMAVDGRVATLTLDVDERGSVFAGCELKLNSYDVGVDIELADAVQRLRFEHPGVGVVVMQSGKERVFCAGANIRMLGRASHRHKVNFCKFTNETRNSMEDASAFSGQKYLCVLAGSAAGGGYELALATDRIVLVDDGSAAVSLPEIPLLAVLPGTGGLTRLTDKRKVRRDRADVFCTTEEGMRGKRAVQWGLVDEAVPRSKLEDAITASIEAMLGESTTARLDQGIALTALERTCEADHIRYSAVEVQIDRELRVATITIAGPEACPPDVTMLTSEGADGWALRCARELDDAVLHLRFNEPEIGVIAFKTRGDARTADAYDAFLHKNRDHWLVRETVHYWKRVLKRIDLTSRSLVALIEPDSCFAGVLAELAFAADRSYMHSGDGSNGETPSATLTLGHGSFGMFPMSNGLTRLQARFLGTPDSVAAAEAVLGRALSADEAEVLGLVTVACEDFDWNDEIRMFLEERASFSPDAMTGMEANLRFGGPETMESKIFARLTAWQNWIFQRPNAVGPAGSLALYGTGKKADFDPSRV